MQLITNKLGTVPWEYQSYVHGWADKESADCTVRAYAKVADIPYDFAHEILQGLGRKFRKGFPFREVTLWDRSFTRPPEMESESGKWHPGYRPTLASFIKSHPIGRYAVVVPGHVMALVDGVVYDEMVPKPGRRVRRAYKYS